MIALVVNTCQESISDKNLLEMVHQSTGILTVLIIKCFCVYAENEHEPRSENLTPSILQQPMVSPSLDFVDSSTTDLKAQ